LVLATAPACAATAPLGVPEPECWSFTLRFAGQLAAIELAYR
jgi:hypothetical protein